MDVFGVSPVSDYAAFLARKAITDPSTGLREVPALNPLLFPFQRDLVAWALRRGRAALWADCGLGKGPMALTWAQHVPGDVLILAPLAVSEQFIREADKFGVTDIGIAKRPEDIAARITVTNYERLDAFDVSRFTGVVLDESSILKAFDGKTRTQLIDSFAQTPFRLCCTATPAPNDFMELGNHAEFLSVMSRAEMLSMFFVHDGGETQQWRLKGHAEKDFWTWLCSWAMTLRKPSDLGYPDDGFTLPPLTIQQTTIETHTPPEGYLFPIVAETLGERLAARRSTIAERVAATAALVAEEPDDYWLIWCNLNTESEALTRAIPGAVQVTGSDDPDVKAAALSAFARGETRVLVSKPSIAGFGMNLQVCCRMAFVGLSDSYEQFYQAVRRCYRFGQTRPVLAHVITADTEGNVVQNIQRKERDAETMRASMVEHMHDLNAETLRGATPRFKTTYATTTTEGDGWTAYQGDCVETLAALADDSIDFTVYSPPFSSLYTYSASDRDMGNCTDDAMFMEHYQFLCRELLRVTKPGRLLSFHCMNLPTSKTRNGHIGIRDFRGDLIRAHEAAGWWYHSEVCIWKDPVTAMQRTKAIGLLHKQLKKDSALSRQGIPDYLVTMRKPGENPERVSHTNETFPVSEWQKIASPVWMDINPSDTLQFRSAREHQDERHIAPLQLEVIRRALRLWSNPGDLVLSPFMGIGSEGAVSLEQGRRFVGVELKESYYRQACRNLEAATKTVSGGLFAEVPA
jgi:DNA modification methylase